MKAKMKIALAVVTALWVSGCERADVARPEGSDRTEKAETVPVSTVSVSEDDVTAVTIARIAVAGVALTNCLYRELDRTMAVYQQIESDIASLPPEIGARCVKSIARNVIAVPYEHLEYRERFRALDKMQKILKCIGLPSMKRSDLWELTILRLSRMRDMVEYTRSEPANKARMNFIAGESEYLKFYSEQYERDLAYKYSPQADPYVLHSRIGKMSEKEYAIVKTKFEVFLGRPIRTYEEIVRAQRERDRQMDLEEERRRGGPDVKVDTGGL
jgi:hypothetical protein